LSIIPFWIDAALVTHNPIFLWSHYWSTIPIHNYFETLTSFADYFNIFMTQAIPVSLAILVLLLLKFPKHLEYAVFIILAIGYEWGNNLAMTYLPAITFSAAVAMPLVSYEWNLIERGKKLLGLEFKHEPTA